jgi:hypothetical protein
MITINPGEVGLFTVFGATDSTGTVPAPVTGGTATISDYTSAYVAVTGNANEYMVVPKITLTPGQKISLTVAFSSALASDGTTVASLSVDLELDGAPVQVPVATALVLGPATTPTATSVTVPADPGSGTIPMATAAASTTTTAAPAPSGTAGIDQAHTV